MTRVRFKIDYNKCIQGMQFLASKKPGITQYYVGKIFFFADREHLLDWGRPISGDRYVAMNHGPVPSEIYNLVKNDSGMPDELLDMIRDRILFENEGNKIHLFANDDKLNFSALSGSDMEYLDTSLKTYGEMSFGQLRELSHRDAAYEAAWAKPGLNNEMNPHYWLAELGEADAVLSSLIDSPMIDRAATRL
ncbi:MAG: hypothetical protein DI498_13760 [Paracoccus denitrificans]|nr:MAG: hypothetical protein DI498_13760 [Paracoccus denitrificans]PZO82874.1 MAG: hypothetical protein DI633_13760 [Paracoccus denitrificans]